MKKLFSVLTASAFALSGIAQTTALDFTANDCDGMSHNLFTELEAGDVVIIELVMMGCQPCVTSANSLLTNVLPNVSDPSRVKLYSIGFTNAITCTQMNNWKSTNSFSHTVFAGISAQTTHYGGMGMPTIAVVGGADHTVFYSEVGHSNSDDPVIIAAVNAALNAGVGVNEQAATMVGISPNPARDLITIAGGAWTNATVLDASGKEVLAGALVNQKLDIGMLPDGAYVIRLSNGKGESGTARFEKQ
ncbi:MAG: T9SS type A sorting domain-containing protein [Flavobacteriales bacterium]|nr:T9SS type A sorting domain-containing protein [Flavobacteriales bacterium]